MLRDDDKNLKKKTSKKRRNKIFTKLSQEREQQK